MKVQVTQEDIEMGYRGDADRCPIAMALARQGATGATVGDDAAIFHIDGKDVDTVLPPVAIDFIHAFDNGRSVAPFEFDLAVPNAD